MKPLKIGNLTIPTPIIQGGMGVGVSLSGLASAVANEGALGMISAVGIGMTEPNYKKYFRGSNKIALRKEIRKARAKSNGVIGVNIMLAVSDYDDLLAIALEEEVDVVVVSAGLPLKMPENLDNKKTKFIPKISSARAAKLIFRHWAEKYGIIPDAIVVEGPLSGGHQGFKKKDVIDPKIQLSSIVKDTIQEIEFFQQQFGIDIPVIAAGGIYSGKDMFEIMAAGAKGVKIGTRFVPTKECDVADEFKQNYISCTPEDITLIDSPVGLPARVITNDFVKAIQNGQQKPVKCPWKCLRTCNYKEVQFCIAEALFSAAQGNFSQGFSFAGTNAYKTKEIFSVQDVISQIKNEFFEAKLINQFKKRKKVAS